MYFRIFKDVGGAAAIARISSKTPPKPESHKHLPQTKERLRVLLDQCNQQSEEVHRGKIKTLDRMRKLVQIIIRKRYETILNNKRPVQSLPKLLPPASITNLANTTGNFWHNWTWDSPTDADFNYTTIYINGTWTVNTSNEYYNLSADAHNQSTITIPTHIRSVCLSIVLTSPLVGLFSCIESNRILGTQIILADYHVDDVFHDDIERFVWKHVVPKRLKLVFGHLE